jgi:hypothetical protein
MRLGLGPLGILLAMLVPSFHFETSSGPADLEGKSQHPPRQGPNIGGELHGLRTAANHETLAGLRFVLIQKNPEMTRIRHVGTVGPLDLDRDELVAMLDDEVDFDSAFCPEITQTSVGEIPQSLP